MTDLHAALAAMSDAELIEFCDYVYHSDARPNDKVSVCIAVLGEQDKRMQQICVKWYDDFGQHPEHFDGGML